MKAALIATALFVGFNALAAAPTTTPNPNDPCEKVKQACVSAGFFPYGHKEDRHQYKGLYLDCINPIVEGATPPGGVNVSTETIHECQGIMAKSKTIPVEKRKGNPAAAPTHH